MTILFAIVAVYVLVTAFFGLIAMGLMAHAHGTTFEAWKIGLAVLFWPVTLPATILIGLIFKPRG